MSDKNKGGCPPKYKEEYEKQVYKLCLLGAIDKEIADFFNVCESTINNWKLVYPEFLESIKKGKMMADAEVSESLYKRAKGFRCEDVHISVCKGKVIQTPIVKQYAPDTGACMAWLKNRQPSKWRDKPARDDGDSESIVEGFKEIAKALNGANND